MVKEGMAIQEMVKEPVTGKAQVPTGMVSIESLTIQEKKEVLRILAKEEEAFREGDSDSSYMFNGSYIQYTSLKKSSSFIKPVH